MSQTARNPDQIDLMIKSFSLRKESIKNQIRQINSSITKKKISIETLRNYAESYEKKTESLSGQTIRIMINNQAFYQQLARVIYSETEELHKLETIKADLVANYHGLANKLDGLGSVRNDIRLEQEVAQDKLEESDLSDLSISRMAKERAWNR